MKIKILSLLFLFSLSLSACATTEETPADDLLSTQDAAPVTSPNLNPNEPMTNENISTVEGLEIYILQEGDKTQAPSVDGDTVAVHYIGTLEDGTEFDQSYKRGEAFDFVLGAGYVIQGWDLGVLGMYPGEKRRLKIASDLGYGSRGAGSAIPPNSTLFFDVELLEIVEE